MQVKLEDAGDKPGCAGILPVEVEDTSDLEKDFHSLGACTFVLTIY